MVKYLLLLFTIFYFQILIIKCELEQLQDVACWKRSYGRGRYLYL